MKIRSRFVSNSSSSSFIVLGSGGPSQSNERNLRAFLKRFVEGNTFVYDPETCFGWNFELYDDWISRFDWAMLQTYYHLYDAQHAYYYETMLDFVREYCPSVEKLVIRSDYAEEWEDDEPTGYIDHQSIGGSNAEFLETVETTKDFILSDNSFVCGQNDNSDVYWKVDDGVPKKTKYGCFDD